MTTINILILSLSILSEEQAKPRRDEPPRNVISRWPRQRLPRWRLPTRPPDRLQPRILSLQTDSGSAIRAIPSPEDNTVLQPIVQSASRVSSNGFQVASIG